VPSEGWTTPEGSVEGGVRLETEGLAIAGTVRIALVAHPDGRGSFTEIYRRDWIPAMREMVQANFSMSRAGVLRGLHFHRRQADYWCVVSGAAFVGLYDLRAGSPTEGTKAELRLAAVEPSALYIPKGVAHGFFAEEDVQLQYLVDEYFTGSDEFGIAWDDPSVGIDWPGSDPILSDRDRSNPTLEEVFAGRPRYET
jgi:dTDP-4-dehydrorhamnose 3,5-epimerase